MTSERLPTRRQVLKSLGFFSAAAATTGAAAEWTRGAKASEVMDRLTSTEAAGSDLGAVEHVIFLMMENRSYDHYFGDYRKGRGFNDHPADSLGVFAQDYPGGSSLSPPGVLLPFHLSPGSPDNEECTDDLTHDWGPMHLCWNGGKMDSFVKTHTSSTYEGSRGAMTMGYYKRQDLPLYYSLADNFTLCDGYHASIIGPTHPNRLMANSGTIDPDGKAGGPIVATNATPDFLWQCKWPTIQEVLEDAGVSWKVYHPSNLGLPIGYDTLLAYPTWAGALYNPTLNPEVMAVSDHVLPYFANFKNPLFSLYQKAFDPAFPRDFISDLKSGKLPAVSWLIPPLGFDEHPAAPSENGMYFTSMVLDALTSVPEVWAKTVVFLMYDENDGWFDHVPPPTAPKGTPGEWVTASPPSIETDPDMAGFQGPMGLGVRVPCLVISPFSAGGHVVSTVYDHTSQLQFLHERWGVEIPNVSAWRKKTVGDLTGTLFNSATKSAFPTLPAPSLQSFTAGSCGIESQFTEQGGADPTIPTKQSMPTQGGGSVPASRWYPAAQEVTASDRVALPADGSQHSTLKSRYNHLAHQLD